MINFTPAQCLWYRSDDTVNVLVFFRRMFISYQVNGDINPVPILQDALKYNVVIQKHLPLVRNLSEWHKTLQTGTNAS